MTIAVLALAAGAIRADVPDATPPAATLCDSRARDCASLADLVDRSCPGACTSRHCSGACLPPFNRGERCGRCQETCARLCGHQAERRHALCRAERRDCRAEVR